ncbi:helix-turn-helix domain-containing protein [Cellulomonas sp.]|uniref:helix-turn-helix domain-containing protein n=1 Tax=Cellulomonas sp. TaxID=40001 RepID=UPI003BAA3D6C
MNGLYAGASDGAHPIDPLLLDAAEAAAHLGVSIATLRKATANGEIAHVRLRARGSGTRDAVRWLHEDLETWVLTHRVPAAPALLPSVRGVSSDGHPTPSRTRVSPRGIGTRGRATPLLSARGILRTTRAD